MEEDRTVETIRSWQQSVQRKMFDFEGNPSVTMEQGRSYGKLRNLLLVRISADYSANFYFDEGGKCVLVYVTDLEVLIGMQPEAIREHFGEADAVLPSRSGPGFSIQLYAQQGFAFSTRGNEIRFFETFPPMEVQEYQAGIHDMSGPG